MALKKSLADQIADGDVLVCCISESNLYVAERTASDTWIRVCRVCHRRHFRMKADPIPLFAALSAPTTTRRTREGRRQIRMPAQGGRVGGW